MRSFHSERFLLLHAHISQLFCLMNADFFLTSILMDFSRIGHALSDSFLNPFIHLILILKESVTTKDVSTCKRGWGHVDEAFSHGWIVCRPCAPPGSF